MSTPNPLMPQGSLQNPGGQSKSNVQLIVFAVIAVHAVLFLGLLVQGCKPDPKTTLAQNSDPELPPENAATAESQPDYYTNFQDLPDPNPAPVADAMDDGRTGLPPIDTLPVAADPIMPFAPEPPRELAGGGGTAPASESYVPPAPAAPLVSETPVVPEVEPITPVMQDRPMQEYTVKSGDSFYAIGKRFKVSMNAIAKANPQVDPTRLQVGHQLVIPVPTDRPATASGGTRGGVVNVTTYKVRAGDNLTKIADKYDTTISAIKEANNLRSDRIFVGQQLSIPVKGRGGGNAVAGGAP